MMRSFDDGLVHWVGIDTEVYHYSHSAGQIERQLNWLKADLAKANQNVRGVATTRVYA